MELPAITLPQINLPFDIPTLLHPAVVHFVVAIPVVILLMEFYNLFTRRKSIGAFAFILLLITVAMLVIAYLTGGVDGKEAYDFLTSEGQAELKEHKLLGVYVLFTAIAVVIFKLLAMTGKGFFRFLYFMLLIGLIAITLKQGKEGGELVYEHGANIERVKTLDDELFDVKEELEELNEKEEVAVKAVVNEVKTEKVEVLAPVVKESVPTPATVEVPSPVIEAVQTEIQTAPVATVSTEPVAPVEPTLHTAPSEADLQNAIQEVSETR